MTDFEKINGLDLLRSIRRCALESMAEPELSWKKQDGTEMTMSELANRNSMIAWFNNGVLQMEKMLITDLNLEDEVGS